MPQIAVHEIGVESGSIPIYCSTDSMLTHEIDEVTASHMTPEAQLIYNFERGLQGPVLEMTQRGFRVDPFERERVIAITESKLQATDHVLRRLVTAVLDNYNPTFPNSTTQLLDFFYTRLGIRPIEVHVKGEVKTPMDRKILERLDAYFYARPFVNAILLHRDLSGTLSVMRTEIDDDWRWRCSYNIAGTTTGRWSSSKSINGTGKNFQNITEELRRVFIPDPGYKLYGIDGEQAEARDVGWYCGTVLGDWSYFDACESGDCHTYVTRLVYPEWAWTGDLVKDKKIASRRFYRHFTYRDASKRLAHASNYYGKAPTISAATKIPLHLVKSFQERYFQAFPCLLAMFTRIATELQTKGYLVNAFGRRRDFLDRTDSDETLRSAVAHMFQSSTGDRTNLGLWKMWYYMGEKIQLLSQLHDAVYWQSREDDEEEICRTVRTLFETPLYDPKSGRKFIVPGEVQGGWNWAHRYKLDDDGNLIDWNPRGLDKIRS